VVWQVSVGNRRTYANQTAQGRIEGWLARISFGAHLSNIGEDDTG
jgi:hypothetical protein